MTHQGDGVELCTLASGTPDNAMAPLNAVRDRKG